MFAFIRQFFSMLTIGTTALEDTFATVGAVTATTRAEAEGFGEAMAKTREARHLRFLASMED